MFDFLFSGVCYCNASMRLIVGGFMQMAARPLVARNNFQEGFGHYTDQNTPFKR